MCEYFKSIIDQDRCAVVICSTSHEIIYMNPAAAERYEKRGGRALLGKSILDCHGEESANRIKEIVLWFEKSEDNNIVYTYHDGKENKDVYMVALRDENGRLIGYYEKHEFRNAEDGAPYDYEL